MSESTANAKEPSMEDILASIRRIIDEEESREGRLGGSDEETLDRLAAVPVDEVGHMPVMSAATSNVRDSSAEGSDADDGEETIFPERESLFWSRATGRNVPVPPYIKPTESASEAPQGDQPGDAPASGESDIFARARNKLDSNSRLSPRERMQALAARAESRSEEAAAGVQETVADAVDDPDMSNVEIFNRADAPGPADTDVAHTDMTDTGMTDAGMADTDAANPGMLDTESPDLDVAGGHTPAADGADFDAADSEKDILELTSALDEVETDAADDFTTVAAAAHDDSIPRDEPLSGVEFADDSAEPDDAKSDNEPGVAAGLATAVAGGLGLKALRDNAKAKASEAAATAQENYHDAFDPADDAVEEVVSLEPATVDDDEQGFEEVFDLTDRVDTGNVKADLPTSESLEPAQNDDHSADAMGDYNAQTAAQEEDIIDTLAPHNGLYGRGDDDIPDTRDDEEVVDVTDMKIDTPDVSAWASEADLEDAHGEQIADDRYEEAAAANQMTAEADLTDGADDHTDPAVDDNADVKFPDTYGASDVYHDEPPALDDDYSASFTDNAGSAATYAAAGATAAGLAGAAAASASSQKKEEDLEAVGGMVRDAMEREPFDYAEPEPSALVSMTSEEISARALASLSDPESDATRRVYGALRLTDDKGAQSLEGMMREMLQPMLREWLDDNLPNVVEGIVRGEVERISSKSHRYKSDPKG